AFWPERLSELGKSSPARHRNAILRAEASLLSATKPAGPIIIAGSTGSLPATADLIAAVANLPEGILRCIVEQRRVHDDRSGIDDGIG
ncbi:hypothetical protein ACC672_37190, partial [Rhizobium ruizarguesonis]